MARGLDHVVHAVRDLDAAADLYRRLGFTVGARNRHPWGTHNRIVQLPGFFIELLTVAEPEKLGGDGFAALFGAFNRAASSQRQRGTLVPDAGKPDAAADAVAISRPPASRSPTALSFEREGSRPDGSPAQGRILARLRARCAALPHIGFAICQQHHPENFWNPAFQQHRQRRMRGRRRRDRGRKSERPSHLPVRASPASASSMRPRAGSRRTDPARRAAASWTRTRSAAISGVAPPDLAGGRAACRAVASRLRDRDGLLRRSADRRGLAFLPHMERMR